MEIRQTSTIVAQWFNNNTSPQRQTASGSAATSADTVTISEAAKNLLAAQASSAASTQSSASAAFDTSQGSMNLDIDSYFTPSSGSKSLRDSLPPLLLPTRNNIAALTSHISDVMPQFLAQNNIPSAPASMTYDNRGEIQLPADYAYADEFKEALENNPTLERELSTVNALTSHLAGIERAAAFQEEYAAASQAQVDAIVAKYSGLFSGNKQHDDITLQFSPSGSLSLTVNGEALT